MVTSSSSGETRVARIVERIRAIPAGFVCTYGDIDPHAPRLVGRVLSTSQNRMPWYRVVRADGSAAMGARQIALLRREGVPFRGDRVDLRRARLPH
jgi:methylated-DNA-protein-cysteine methyltransferase-like protein